MSLIISGKDVLKVLACEYECLVECPCCGEHYNHIKHVGTLMGSDKDEAVAAYPGTDTVGSTEYRRSALEIVFWCETCDDLFALVIQQHKGQNFVQVHTQIGKKEMAD